MMNDNYDLFEKEDLSKRLKILTALERQEHYDLPAFSDTDREYFFNLSTPELGPFHRLKSTNSKILYLIQLGYFKAKKRFFNMDPVYTLIKADIAFVIQRDFPDHKIQTVSFSKNTRTKQEMVILELFSYRDSSECGSEIIFRHPISLLSPIETANQFRYRRHFINFAV